MLAMREAWPWRPLRCNPAGGQPSCSSKLSRSCNTKCTSFSLEGQSGMPQWRRPRARRNALPGVSSCIPTSWCPVRAWPAMALRRSATGQSGIAGHGVCAQSHGRLRADRPRRPDPRPPAVRHRPRDGRQPRGRGARACRARDAVRDAAALQEGRRPSRSRACCWSRRCPVISRRCCAAPCARCCPSTTSTLPTGTMRATSRLAHGRFGFDEYIEHMIRFLEAIGPGAHVVAVCQPCVAALVRPR